MESSSYENLDDIEMLFIQSLVVGNLQLTTRNWQLAIGKKQLVMARNNW